MILNQSSDSNTVRGDMQTDMYDNKSEYYIPNWAAKMGPERDFVSTLWPYKCYGEE